MKKIYHYYYYGYVLPNLKFSVGASYISARQVTWLKSFRPGWQWLTKISLT